MSGLESKIPTDELVNCPVVAMQRLKDIRPYYFVGGVRLRKRTGSYTRKLRQRFREENRGVNDDKNT